MEGFQLWDLIARLGDRQVRATSGVILGWDMGAALQMGAALGIDGILIAEVLPEVEPVAMAALRERLTDD